MIAVDTSALIAVLLEETEADACIAALRSDDLTISAGTLAEALIVAGARGLERELLALVSGLAMVVAPVSETVAHRVAQAYARWGKGSGAATLNFGDCFAYVLAQETGCALLFIGDDFRRTDVRPAL